MVCASRNLARLIWIHKKERDGDLGKEDLLAKLYTSPQQRSINVSTCINMIMGFVIATKYHLRREPGYDHPDLRPLIQNLSTFAKTAYLADGPLPHKQISSLRRAGQFLGVPGTSSDPLKPLRKGPKYHGNLPFEILNYISAFMQLSIADGTINVAIVQTQALNGLTTLLECLTGMERVLGTPLPLAYNIAISQITWAYILVLPFQLYNPLGWIAIPGTLGTIKSLKNC